MAPVPFRGKRCDPGMLCRMAEKIAEILEMPVEDVQKLTFENGRRLYRLDEIAS